MLGRAVDGKAGQDILRDTAHEIRGNLPDRLRFHRFGRGVIRFEQQGDVLMLLKLDRLQRAKDAVLVDSLQVLRHRESQCSCDP